jgi:hypothetical protein
MLQIFGKIEAPEALENFGTVEGGALGKFLQVAINLLIVGAGIYALFNLILAGYAFLSAGDDPKKAAGAWAKIWQTIVGLLFVAGAFVLAAIFGKILFNDYSFLLKPVIPTLQ